MVLLKQCLLVLAFLGGFFASATSAISQESRAALVIGNSNYNHLPRLRNPANDAETIATALSNLGFTVFLASDLTQSELVKALAVYAEKSSTADVSLVYYAGHSAALGTQNLIFPTDFNPNNQQHISSLVKLSDVTALMQNGAGTNILLFDACQEPLTLDTSTGQIALQSLSPQNPPVGTLISYASTPGHAAHDGNGHHSIFAGALLDNLATPDVDIEKTLRLVRRDVIRNSQGVQVPQTNSSLITEFFLYPTVVQNTAKTLQNALMQNGFSQKPILSSIASGVLQPPQTPEISDEQMILRDILCAKLSPPRPAICSK
jgi:uncharacterized caspase-like protein